MGQIVHLSAHNERVLVSEFKVEKFKFKHHQRGWVGGFSKFSKRRLMEIFFSFKACPFKTFWCFTFAEDVPADYAKKEINRLNNIFRRRHVGYLWVMEYTKKNRIHFHYALTDCLAVKWVTALWGNGRCSVSKVFAESGLRKYFVSEVSKGNQKKFHGFNGRWWGVSRCLNMRYSLGVYTENLLHDLVSSSGYKRNFYRDDFEKLGLDFQQVNNDKMGG